MKTYRFICASIVGAIAMVTSSIAHADPTNEDEAATGAAALIVLSQKCSPESENHFSKEAHGHLAYMLQKYPSHIKNRAKDDLNMKVKALKLSSTGDTCMGAQRLHSLAFHWGYAHLLQTMNRR